MKIDVSSNGKTQKLEVTRGLYWIRKVSKVLVKKNLNT